jgi:hypothetical protein
MDGRYESERGRWRDATVAPGAVLPQRHGDQVRSNISDVMHEDGVGCVRVLAAQKELADGAEDLPLLGNALQGMHTEILELDARARD